MDSELYSTLSVKLSKIISKDIRQKEGIYFSSKNAINQSLHIIQPFLKDNMHILEPSCGTCEFIHHIDGDNSGFANCTIDCIEYNQSIYNEIKDLTFKNHNVNITHANFLTYDTSTKYNLIIGNPPYFVIPKTSVDKKYHPYFTGRPNIFNIFIAKSLDMLAENGILCFILPTSFLNCIYYDNIRAHIYNHYDIIAIEPCNNAKFIDTVQETIVFVLQKKKPSSKNQEYAIMKNGFTILQDRARMNIIKHLYEKSTTLHEMGFKVSVGTVVWNQVKSELTNDTSQPMLIYSSNIENYAIVEKQFKDEKKKQYINRDGLTDCCLIVNRGYGNGEYKFDYAIIDQKHPYLLENHIISIVPKSDMTKQQLLVHYRKIIESFENEKTKQFIGHYFSNNAINTTELQHILPIY